MLSVGSKHRGPRHTGRMVTRSAAVLPYLPDASDPRGVQVWLAHMGGPFWARKDDASWTLIKGEFDESEEPLLAAAREWREETGTEPPAELTFFGEFRQSSRKTLTVFLCRIEDPASVRLVRSNTFALEWPPRSGKVSEFPEIDRAEWFALPRARDKILRGQLPILDALETQLGGTARAD